MESRGESRPAVPIFEAVPPAAPDRPASALRWIVANLEELVTATLLATMIGSVGLSVLCRYVLQMPLSWTEEVVLLCMVWTCFLGASIVTKHKEHIVIDFVVSLVPRGLAKAMEVFSTLVILAVLAVLLWQGIRLLEVTQYVTTTALGIPTMYMYTAVPVSAMLMLVHSLRHLDSVLRH